eukprot:354639-Chlamydomonas_euryale.AAC.4
MSEFSGSSGCEGVEASTHPQASAAQAHQEHYRCRDASDRGHRGRRPRPRPAEGEFCPSEYGRSPRGGGTVYRSPFTVQCNPGINGGEWMADVEEGFRALDLIPMVTFNTTGCLSITKWDPSLRVLFSPWPKGHKRH